MDNEGDKGEDVMLPGFRFHPTDEELVGFYLKRKILQRPLPMELIKQLDIYKHDPWDLPKMAATGEKEWYFYCPRDRKYRNSTRPNRVTSAGFWKATGTDRPIYSSEGTKCIGLKKSLVFYKGRAARGIKTDWMMHEFRLPSVPEKSLANNPLSANVRPCATGAVCSPSHFCLLTARISLLDVQDSWAICRIFKKNSSAAHKLLPRPWSTLLPRHTSSDAFSQTSRGCHFGSETLSCITEAGSSLPFCSPDLHQSSGSSFSPLDHLTFKPSIAAMSVLPPRHISTDEAPSGFFFSSLETTVPDKCTADATSGILSIPPSIIGAACVSSVNAEFVTDHQKSSQYSGSTCPQATAPMFGSLFSLNSSLAPFRKPGTSWNIHSPPIELSATCSTNNT